MTKAQEKKLLGDVAEILEKVKYIMEKSDDLFEEITTPPEDVDEEESGAYFRV